MRCECQSAPYTQVLLVRSCCLTLGMQQEWSCSVEGETCSVRVLQEIKRPEEQDGHASRERHACQGLPEGVGADAPVCPLSGDQGAGQTATQRQ